MKLFFQLIKIPRIIMMICAILPMGCVKKSSIESLHGKEELTYFELTFEGKVAAMGANDNYDIEAIGVNSDKSLIYFTHREKTGLDSYDPSTGAVVHIATDLVPFNSKILNGPSNRVLLLTDNNDKRVHRRTWTEAFEITGNKVERKTKLGITGVAISAAATCSGGWVAFFEQKAFSPGIHLAFDGVHGWQPGPGSGREPKPLKNIDTYIDAFFCSGKDLYLGEISNEHANNVIKYSGDLDQNIDFTKNILMSSDDLEMNKGEKIDSKISALAVVGDYLIVGKHSLDEYNDIILLRLSDMKKSKFQSKDIGNVSKIAVSNDNNSAMISTNKGLVFFYGGKLVNIANEGAYSYKRLDTASVSESQPLAFTNDKPANFDFSVLKSGAVHVGDYWYVAGKNGVFKIKMFEKKK